LSFYSILDISIDEEAARPRAKSLTSNKTERKSVNIIR